MDEALVPLSDAKSAESDSLTYEAHFGLREKPFSLSPNPRFFLRQSSHAAAFEALIAGIRRREGILALTGEVGTGKTTLCRSVLDSLDRKTFAAFVPDPMLSREDLLKTLLVDFGVVSLDDIKAGRLRGASRTDLSYTLCEFLTSLHPLKAFAVVMIDEAQNLPTTLLEEIRILCDLEHGEKLLQLVLVGQPELQVQLSQPEMRQVRQRISVRCKLDPLAQDEVKPYISHRLGVAGNSDVAFDEDAIRLIYAATVGIPRVINLLCDRALFRAASAGETTVRIDHIVGAADDLWIPVAASASTPLEPGTAGVPPTASARQDAASRSHAPRQGLPSTYEMRHDAHYVEELEARTKRRSPENTVDISVVVPQATISKPEPPGKHLVTLVAVATVAAVIGGAGIWSLRSATRKVAEPIATESAREATTSRLDTLPTPEPTPAPSPAPLSQGAASAEVVAPTFAVQMATFRSKARATESIRELGAAGYSAFSAEIGLRDGERAFGVFLGPYADRTAAELDLERAQMTPGYGIGRVVQIGVAR
jgi:type II secretory pathway predicted ATPase ExeA/cell division septation protein DedD